MRRSTALLLSLSCALGALVLGASIYAAAKGGTGRIAQCPDAAGNPLPLPSSRSPDDFHDQLLAFLQNGEYATRARTSTTNLSARTPRFASITRRRS